MNWVALPILALALVCFGSFAWAMQRFFVKPGRRPPGMQAIYVLGSLFTVLHLGVILWRFHPQVATTTGGALLYLGALALFWWSVAANRARPLAFAFASDRPEHLVTVGPYRYIRHPFYTAYTLAWIAGAVVVPAPWLLLTAAVMFGLYWGAARREEAGFAASALAAAYAHYRRRSGMFFPKLLPVRPTQA